MKNSALSALLALGIAFMPGFGFSLLDGGPANMDLSKAGENQRNTAIYAAPNNKSSAATKRHIASENHATTKEAITGAPYSPAGDR